MPSPCGVPDSSCSSTLRSASASACSWRCCIIATFAWLPQMVATTSPARTIIASRSAWRSAAIASSRRPSCASVTPLQRMDQGEIAADRPPRAAPTPPARCARGRSRCRRPAGSRGRARSGRGRWRASRGRARPASAPWPSSAMPRDGSPLAIASLPCSRHSSDRRAGCRRSRSSGGSPERVGRLPHVVLEKPRFGQRGRICSLSSRLSPGCFSARTSSDAASEPWPCCERLHAPAESLRERHARSIPRIQPRRDYGSLQGVRPQPAAQRLCFSPRIAGEPVGQQLVYRASHTERWAPPFRESGSTRPCRRHDACAARRRARSSVVISGHDRPPGSGVPVAGMIAGSMPSTSMLT